MRNEIQKLGFAALGIASHEALKTWAIYEQSLQKTLPPQLEYLRKNATCRKDFEAIMTGTKCVLCCAVLLPKFPDNLQIQCARFCAIGDYHQVVRQKLAQLDLVLREHFPIKNSRICVDTAPVLERELAVRAGLGTIGYNRMLIHPDFGSFIALGELLIDLDLSSYRSDIEICVDHKLDKSCDPNHCQGCHDANRCCVRACPVGALSNNGYDVNRCLAYWTTQHKGLIPKEFAVAMGEVLWGCDRCQNHCPRNISVHPYSFVNDNNPLNSLTFEEILTLSARQIKKKLSGTCIADAHPYMLQRNACIVIGNAQKREYWDLVAQVAQNHPCDWVRETAKSVYPGIDKRGGV